MTEQKEWFARLYRSILTNKKLNPIDKLLVSIIWNYQDNGNICYASNKYLSDLVGCSVRAVQSSIQKLDNLGLIVVERPSKNERTISKGVQIMYANDAPRYAGDSYLGMQEVHPNIKENNIKEIKNNNIKLLSFEEAVSILDTVGTLSLTYISEEMSYKLISAGYSKSPTEMLKSLPF